MRKNRVWLAALAVVLLGTSMVAALGWTTLGTVLSGSGPTVTAPTLNGPFWLQPIPSSVIAGSSVAASFTVGNPYPFSLVGLELLMNFTGSGVTAACVTAGNCLSGSVTVPSSGTVSFSFCSACSTASVTPTFVIVAIIPTLQSGISTMSLNLVFQHPGAYNELVYFALNAPYP